jgi:hypothetical protein
VQPNTLSLVFGSAFSVLDGFEILTEFLLYFRTVPDAENFG